MRAANIIAEIGCNHRGDLDTAKEMILVAATFCKVDAVKFQKRHPRELLTPAQYAAPHPNPMHAYGSTYGEHREALEFSAEQHQRLKDWCDQFGVLYTSSVWDLTSARDIVALQPLLIKVPSACNLNFDMLGCLCDSFGGEIHVSLGMTTRAEEEQIVSFFERKARNQDLVVYSCTSAYPVPFEAICLGEITRLSQRWHGTVKDIGFSGHHLGIAADVAALTLGARWIERHFTLDRTWKGTDHAASLEPDGMRRLVRDIRNVALALGHKEQDILDVEAGQRAKLKWRPTSAASA